MNKLLLALLTTSTLLLATSSEMDALLNKANQASKSDTSLNSKRELRFKNSLKNRENLLKEAKRELKKLKNQSIRLNNSIDANEKKLTKLEEKLHQRSGNLGELYGVVKQFSSDLYAEFSLSATTVLAPSRLNFLKKLSETKRLPNTQTLSKLWYVMLEELHFSSLTQSIPLEVVASNGKASQKNILFVGPFTQSSKEDIYTYDSNTKTLKALSSSPANALDTLAEAQKQTSGVVDSFIDPTRGTILSLSTQTPDITERIEQGSTVGYVILALGILGLMLALYRGLKLFLIELAIKKKNELSPLEQLHSFYNEHNLSSDRESLEMLFEQQLSRAQSEVEKGLPIIKLLAAVAPLLGLLGTVTGMIATFSAITLFGTGDPKLMAGGISQALITTVEGLIIAIPLLFSYTLLNNRAKSLMGRLNEEALLLLAKHS
jgi:biopolymer transport protein ExbB